MRLIEQKAEIIKQQTGIEGIYKMIEIAGRTCYKSLDKITETSAKDFVDRMIKSNHLAMLEHGTIYLQIRRWLNPGDTSELSKYEHNPYSKYNELFFGDRSKGFYVTTNLRVLQENNWLDDLQYLCEPTEFHEKRITFRLITSRHVAMEAIRHRTISPAMESQRYCGYNKNKFDGQITFIQPSWFNPYNCTNNVDMKIAQPFSENGAVIFEQMYMEYNADGKIDTYGHSWTQEDFFIWNCRCAEEGYMQAIRLGATPQQARVVLPNATKTELVMTGFESDWKHFFDLRYFETTGKVDPDMEDLSTKMVEELNKNNIKI